MGFDRRELELHDRYRQEQQERRNQEEREERAAQAAARASKKQPEMMTTQPLDPQQLEKAQAKKYNESFGKPMPEVPEDVAQRAAKYETKIGDEVPQKDDDTRWGPASPMRPPAQRLKRGWADVSARGMRRSGLPQLFVAVMTVVLFVRYVVQHKNARDVRFAPDALAGVELGDEVEKPEKARKWKRWI